MGKTQKRPAGCSRPATRSEVFAVRHHPCGTFGSMGRSLVTAQLKCVRWRKVRRRQRSSGSSATHHWGVHMAASTKSRSRSSRARTASEGPALTVAIADGRCRVVHICGDLDIATRDEFYEACVTGDHSAVVIDMSRLTFLDCSGYGALVAVRLAIQQRGGSVVVRRPMGQPAHLLTLLAESGVV
ncbi:MAG: STAS domain-containing protein [Ilumatobacteraceae bacterium]